MLLFLRQSWIEFPIYTGLGNVMQELREEGVQRAEGTSQLQYWNMERKDLESRREIGEHEKGNAEE